MSSEEPHPYPLILRKGVSTTNPPFIPFGELEWELSGPEEDIHQRLVATIYIGAMPMHLEAYEVFVDAEGIQRTRAWTDDLDLVFQGLTCEGEWHTVNIADREYVLLAQPFCR